MSDKTYWVNKNVKRQINKCDLFALDSGTSKSWASTGMMVCIITLVFGLMQYFMKASWGLYLAIGSGVLAIVFFIVNRVCAINAYTEYCFVFDDKEMVFQTVGKKIMTFACEGVKIKWEKGNGAKDVNKLYKPYITHKVALEAIYDGRIRKGEMVDYIAKTKAVVDGKEKDVVYKIKLDGKNTMQSLTINSLTLNAYFLKEGQQKILVPIALYNAIRAKGLILPSESMIVLDYGVKENTVRELKR